MKKKWMLLPIFLLVIAFCLEMPPVKAEVTASTKYGQVDYELHKNIYSWLFEIDGGLKYAFCIERSAKTPSVGSPTGEWVEIFNEDMRKVLYYGYGGPMNMGYNVVETSCAAAAANGDNNTTIGDETLEEIQLLATPPANFRVWKVETNGGETQDIAFFTKLLTGELCVEKVSSKGNERLEGAVYGVYSDRECTDELARLTTDETGMSETITLDEGTYYLKEITAPEGYELSEEVVEAKVLVERKVTVTLEDEPIVRLTDFAVHKQNQIGECLAGAQIGIYEDAECTKEIAVGTTDETGQIIFEDLNLGFTYYVKELTAPEGYFLSDEIYEVVADGSDFTVIDEKIFELPYTGSWMGILVNGAGVSCIIFGLKKKGK